MLRAQCARFTCSRESIDAGFCQQLHGDKVNWAAIHFDRRSSLNFSTALQKQNLVTQRKGIPRITARIDDNRIGRSQQVAQLVFQSFAQLEVEIHQGFVEQQGAGVFGQRAGDRQSLLLTTG